MMEKEIEDIIQEYNSNGDYSSDARYACREKIGIVVKRAKGAFIIIDTDVHARSTVWRYEIARIDPDRSYIYGMFYAHSDKPISNMKSLCDDCKTTVKKCDRCHDYDTEVDSIDQETHRYGGHIIKVDQNLHESFFVRHAKRLIELDGEYHNMLPNKTGEGRLWFVRQRREVIESSYMPPDMIHLAQYYRKSRTGIFVRKVGSKIRKAVKMDPRNEYGGLFTAEELGVIRKSKRLEIVLEKVVDELEKHMVENLESDIHSTKITKERLYVELAKLVTVNRMKEYVKDGIDHNLKSFVKKAEMKMNLEKKTYSADLYDKNKNPVGRVVPMSVFPDNYYRLAVHVYVFSETGYVRMTDADSQFVKIEGYVRSGETNFEAASRILFEYTGIQRRINENNIAISQTKDMLMEDHFVYKILPGDNFSGNIKVDLEPTESFEEYCSESGIIVDTEVITAVRMKSKEL